VEKLRGTKGADFEGRGYVTRGVEGIGFCGCFGGSGERHVERFLLIKGPFCFVFADEQSSSPKYCIGLHYLRAKVKPEARGGSYHVLLTDNLGDVQYEITFASEDVASQFAKVVKEQASTAEAEEARKRLGHEALLTKRSSVKYAETIAKKKEADQPDAPISTQEIMDNMPVTAM
jgi:hypothetical protein